MRKVLLTGAALMALSGALSTAAFAQSTTSHNPTRTTQPAASTTTGTAVSGDEFASIPAGEELSSKVVGLDVYNSANTNIGKIKDVAFDNNGVKAYIVAVGGFLGMGDHYVAVKPSAVNISYDSSAKKWHAVMNTDAAQLKAAPEYKYSSND